MGQYCMNFKAFITILVIVICTQEVSAQGTCTLLGQNPSTAFPVCGTNVFTQTTVPNCGGRRVPVPCSDNAQYSDVGPFWYKFTCFKTGTLGLQVIPVQASDDYDWQIFDITGKDPNL